MPEAIRLGGKRREGHEKWLTCSGGPVSTMFKYGVELDVELNVIILAIEKGFWDFGGQSHHSAIYGPISMV